MSSESQRNPLTIVAIIGGMIAAMYVAASILLGEGNQLAGLFFYVMAGCGVLGVAAPRLAFTVFIIQAAYLDLLKRFMVMAGHVSYGDLFWVLGIAPVTVVGITAGLVLRMIFGQVKFDGSDVRRLVIAVLLNVVMAGFIFFKGGGITGTLREVANGASYSLLLFIVPLLFVSPESVAKFTRFIILVFLPVAAYGIYQQVFGFQDFEIEYLKTPGLTIEIKQLEANRVRAFSTLNSPTSLSVVVCSVAMMALSLALVGSRAKAKLMSLPVAGLILLLMVAGWAASTVRVGILLLPVALTGMYVFRRSGATRLFYTTLISAFIALVASSEYLFMHIENWTRRLMELAGGSTFAEYLLNMNSYKDRLYGFHNVLANPAAYTWFGMGGEGERDTFFAGHDPLSNALLSFGMVPVTIGLVLMFFALRSFHRVVYRMNHPALQLFASAFLANAAGNVAVSMVNGNLLGVFPVNVFFWICLGFAATLSRADAALAPLPAPTPSPESMRPEVPRRSPGRFAPVPRQPLS